MTSRWYAFHTKSHAEQRLASSLRIRGFEVYSPMLVSRKPDARTAREPLFPGYLFVNLNLEEVDSSEWRWTPGLRHIVAYGDVPVPIPGEVIQLINQRTEALNEAHRIKRHPFKPGDPVRIKNGPFADVIAIFDGPTTPSERVSILLEALNRTIRLRVDVSSLEKVSNSKLDRSRSSSRRSRGRGRKNFFQ